MPEYSVRKYTVVIYSALADQEANLPRRSFPAQI